MTFGDLKSTKGLKELNSFLAYHSYINGYSPSNADISVFDDIVKTGGDEFPHLQRWYRHIASFNTSERIDWSGEAVSHGVNTTATIADDEVDLFGTDDEDDEEAIRIREERVAAYAAKKSKKPALIAKSSVLLDVKPWDDETDMKEIETNVRSIEMDGLLWGASKLVPVGYGIKKLQIMCVIEDEKVSIDLLTEKIEAFEEFVQSVDIAAFNKI